MKNQQIQKTKPRDIHQSRESKLAPPPANNTASHGRNTPSATRYLGMEEAGSCDVRKFLTSYMLFLLPRRRPNLQEKRP